MESKELKALNNVYLEAVYGKAQSAGQELAKREKDDDAFGAPRDKRHVVTNADKKANTPAYQKYKSGDKNYKAADHMKEEELLEKQKDTPDQVKAVIAYDKARKGTEDATYDTEHGDKKQAKKERDYAKWQRDKGAEDAQKSGHPWEHAKGSTREKAGKKSEKHAHIKDSYQVLPGKSIDDMTKIYIEGIVKKELKALKKGTETLKQKNIDKADEIADEYVPSEMITKLVESGKFSKEEIAKMVEIERLGMSQVSESGWHRRNPDKVGTPEDPDYDVLRGQGKPVKDSKPATTGKASKKPPGIYKPDKDGKMVRQPD